VIHGKPVSSNLTIQVSVPDCGMLKLRPEGLDAAVRHVVLHRRVDEAAALAGLGQPVNGLDRGFRQDDVDAFAHGVKVNDLASISYTQAVCMSIVISRLHLCWRRIVPGGHNIIFRLFYNCIGRNFLISMRAALDQCN
jgi:hypothetical protein